MLLSIEVDLKYRCATPCNFLLQIEVAKYGHQNIINNKLNVTPSQVVLRSNADDSIGKRVWLRVEDEFSCKYKANIEITRNAIALENVSQSPIHDIQGEVIKYIMPSRYCHLEKFEGSVPKQFSDLKGGKLVLALCEWIKNEFTYVAGVSDASTTAHDTLNAKQGVCRDYAHVLISMLRVSMIPARIVSGYAPSVSPQDFHALVEVYLEGAWYLVDPTGMTTADEVAIIGVGRDAADISFLTSYGFLTMINQSVSVNIIEKAESYRHLAC